MAFQNAAENDGFLMVSNGQITGGLGLFLRDPFDQLIVSGFTLLPNRAMRTGYIADIAASATSTYAATYPKKYTHS